MAKDDPRNKDDVTGAAGLEKIAKGLSDIVNLLTNFDQLPRYGRHEKGGKVFEYSFKTRSLGEAAGEEPEPETPRPAREASTRRGAKRSPLEILEPVTDVFDEADQVMLLFELPGVERKDIRCFLDGDILLLEARAGDRLYRKELLIEHKLTGSPKLALRNGILEVRLSKQG